MEPITRIIILLVLITMIFLIYKNRYYFGFSKPNTINQEQIVSKQDEVQGAPQIEQQNEQKDDNCCENISLGGISKYSIPDDDYSGDMLDSLIN